MPPIGGTRHSGGGGSRPQPHCGRIAPFDRGLAMRWILLLLTLSGFTLGFSARSSSLMWLGFALGLVFLVVAFFAFAAARVAANSRSDAVLLADKDIVALRSSLRKPAAEPPPTNPA
jgi:hypothetical protein